MAAKQAIKYFVVDAFADSPFKGNPAAVCILEEEKEDEWMQALAAEFNISITCYLIRINEKEQTNDSLKPSKFSLRWFSPVTEIEMCGHATLAAAHALFSYGLVNSDTIEFSTLLGNLTTKRVSEVKPLRVPNVHNSEAHESYLIEFEFPTIPLIEVNSANASIISKALNVDSMIDIKMVVSKNFDNFLVVLPSAKDVIDFEPNFDEIKKCPGSGIIITGAPSPSAESKFDFYTRMFCPKSGINEEAVCGRAHCALAVYWAKKLGKSDFVAYMASPRSGILNVHLDEQKENVLLRGKAITITEGVVLV
ncbi:uncharacterized protein LOC111456017 [Cucurbita moschata]|uniref:Uncharacterized protein LOC111456017 n=1 Tax=Cucurbita moschata TaxID=3662 RepID=A0A6J1GNF9_CUCMO|nr:uncharacterized protein LOC111456017 [Cucurbita moschata]